MDVDLGHLPRRERIVLARVSGITDRYAERGTPCERMHAELDRERP
jgi:hypothetical protein